MGRCPTLLKGLTLPWGLSLLEPMSPPRQGARLSHGVRLSLLEGLSLEVLETVLGLDEPLARESVGN